MELPTTTRPRFCPQGPQETSSYPSVEVVVSVRLALAVDDGKLRQARLERQQLKVILHMTIGIPLLQMCQLLILCFTTRRIQ